MAPEVEIANLAGTIIGDQPTLVSLDDNKNLARTLKAVWNTTRRATLRTSSYNFATKRAGLPASADAVPFPWKSAFPLPADCLRLIEVLGCASRADYQLESGAVLCNQAGPLYIRYIWDVEEIALWDDAAANAFALGLALTCGRRIAGSAFDADLAKTTWKEITGAAKHTDALENPPIRQEESDWITARFGGWYR